MRSVYALLPLVMLTFAACDGTEPTPEPTPSPDVTVEMGSEGGACYGNGTCNENLVCSNDLCESFSIADGDLGGACYGNGSCNDGLGCVDDVCVDENAAAGTLGGVCRDDGSCDSGLACANSICIERTAPPVDGGTSGDDAGAPEVSTATETVTPENGGDVVAGDALVSVPPNAVDEDTAITITVTDQRPPAGYDAYSYLVTFEPAGLVFSQAVEVRIPFEPGTTPPTLYWSKSGGGYEALPTIVQNNIAISSITHFSAGFVAGNQGCQASCPGITWGDDDGCGFACACDTGFDAQPDFTCSERQVDCLAIDRGEIKEVPEAGLRVGFRLLDCSTGQEGLPVRRLSLGNEGGSDVVRVINLENGQDFNASVEGGSRSALARPSNFALYTMVALDMSNSIVGDANNPGVAAEVIDAAEAFVRATVEEQPQGLQYRVGLMVFGRTSAIEIVFPFSNDASRLYAALNGLRARFTTPGAVGLGSTNLYGAYTQAIDQVVAQGAGFELVERSVLVLTDGVHEAGGAAELHPAAVALKEDAALNSGLSAFSVYVSPTTCADAPSVLQELATNNGFFFCAEGADALGATFENIAQQVAGIADSNYAVGVCTPVELGTPYVRIEVELAGGASSSLELSYSTAQLTGDLSTCNVDDLAYPCENLECGAGLIPGITCGSCIDTAFCSATQQCDALTVCAPGEFEVSPAGVFQDRVCQPCAAGTWDDDGDSLTACVSHFRACIAGETLTQSPSATEDRVCEPCADGFWDDDANDATVCVAHSGACVPGETEGNPGNASIDHICIACVDGSWDDDGESTTNCVPHFRECQWGETQTQVPSATSDRICEMCADGYWDDDMSPVTECIPYAAECVAGEWESTSPNRQTNRVCESCVIGSTWDHDGLASTQCQPISTFCQSGQEESQHPSATEDRICQDCQAGYWDNGDVISPCVLHTQCTASEDNYCAVTGRCPQENGYTDVVCRETLGLDSLGRTSRGSAFCGIIGQFVKCWGRNDGVLSGARLYEGFLPTDPYDTPISSAVSVGVGYAFGCALKVDGDVYCWGKNAFGETGGTAQAQLPTAVSGISNAIQLSVGKSHACALLSGGTMKCWGNNTDGQLGDGTNISTSIPVSVLGIAGAVKIDAGPNSSCAIAADGSMSCWGQNVGNGLAGAVSIPEQVTVVSEGITSTSSNGVMRCAVTLSGKVRCWGGNGNNYSTLGDGITGSSYSVSIEAAGVLDAVDVQVLETYACILVQEGDVLCWGRESGKVYGDNYPYQGGSINTNGVAAPYLVAGFSGALSMSVSDSGVCVLNPQKRVKCWGSGHLGQDVLSQFGGSISPNSVWAGPLP